MSSSGWNESFDGQTFPPWHVGLSPDGPKVAFLLDSWHSSSYLPHATALTYYEHPIKLTSPVNPGAVWFVFWFESNTVGYVAVVTVIVCVIMTTGSMYFALCSGTVCLHVDSRCENVTMWQKTCSSGAWFTVALVNIIFIHNLFWPTRTKSVCTRNLN